ncbi:hypothetical protein L2E82_06437 [Cichorium intybus]|uniref:Uncharacterized protein n=1 Tax=Cichorium intybus TaxID=13427 RepID=A0ACB9H9V6_CICIN|nr:hypothetical protein L2E82_06437 [Cichorium intybus]
MYIKSFHISTCLIYNSIPMNINRTASDGGTIILNKYQLTRLLGRGSFTKVYHGRYGTRLRWGAFHTAVSPWTDEGSYCTEILSADRVDS